METPLSPLNQANAPAADEPGEPCPTPLSTLQVFKQFVEEVEGWEVEGPFGPIPGCSIGQGPPLYFLNGLEGTSELYRLLAWLLREDFRCVLFDAPAAETAAARVDDPSQIPDVRQLLAVADRLGDESFQIYGSGFGGWLGLLGMLARPARIQAAILQAAYAKRRFKLLEKLLLWAGRRSSRAFRDVPGWRKVFEQNHQHWFPPFDAARFEIFAEIAGGMPVRDLSQRVRQLSQVRIEDQLSKISQPVLLLNTEGEGRLHASQLEFLKDALPHARSEVLQNSGLVPHWTHPHRVAKLIRQFLVPSEPEPVSAASVK